MWRDDELIRDGNLQYNTLIYCKLGTGILQSDGHQLRYVSIRQTRQRTSQEPYHCESGSAPVHLESGGGARIKLGANRYQFPLDDKLRSRYTRMEGKDERIDMFGQP
jgi:hypothetical protein